MEQFTWNPGDGIDSYSLERMRSHFGRPKEPMGEAWFMGAERYMYRELQADLSALSIRELQNPLEEIASGTSSFGRRDEWNSWYHYLLGQTLPRAHERFVSPLLELLITSFIAIYPNGITCPPYPEFQSDALNTLGKCIMEPSCWDGDEIVIGNILHRSDKNPNKVWCWWNASGDFSASVFFCLKYLPEESLADWFLSVLNIKSPHWRAQVIVWLVGVHKLLLGELRWPSDFEIDSRPAIDWEWSHCLGQANEDECVTKTEMSFLSESKRHLLMNIVHNYFNETKFSEWTQSINQINYIKSELAQIPSTFKSIYVAKH